MALAIPLLLESSPGPFALLLPKLYALGRLTPFGNRHSYRGRQETPFPSAFPTLPSHVECGLRRYGYTQVYHRDTQSRTSQGRVLGPNS